MSKEEGSDGVVLFLCALGGLLTESGVQRTLRDGKRMGG